MAGLDLAIQAATRRESRRGAPQSILQPPELDGRVKPGHDAENGLTQKRGIRTHKSLPQSVARFVATPCDKTARASAPALSVRRRNACHIEPRRYSSLRL